MRKLTRVGRIDLPAACCWPPAPARCARRRRHPPCRRRRLRPRRHARRHGVRSRLRRLAAAASSCYRGGTLSRLGHNHVMTSQIAERTRLDASGVRALGFRAVVPGRAADRRRSARRGARRAATSRRTSRNRIRTARARTCCGRRCWTPSSYPEVKLQSAKVGGTLQAPQVTARITIKDASRDVRCR